LDRLSYWLNSCSYDDQTFSEADELCKRLIAPYFHEEKVYSLEEFITTTIKLYKEVVFIRDNVLGDKFQLHYGSRKAFAENVMSSWISKHPSYRTIIAAVCYELTLL